LFDLVGIGFNRQFEGGDARLLDLLCTRLRFLRWSYMRQTPKNE